jgi:hypothetical protein
MIFFKTFAEKNVERKGRNYDADLRNANAEIKRLRSEITRLHGLNADKDIGENEGP